MKKIFYTTLILLSLSAPIQSVNAGVWVTKFSFVEGGQIMMKQHCEQKFLSFQCQPGTTRDKPTGILMSSII